MDLEETKKVLMKEKEKSLRISRIPSRIRENFINLANAEFEGDYGMVMKFLWEKYEEYLYFFNNFETKLDYIIELSKTKTEQIGNGVKLLSGRVVKGGVVII